MYWSRKIGVNLPTGWVVIKTSLLELVGIQYNFLEIENFYNNLVGIASWKANK